MTPAADVSLSAAQAFDAYREFVKLALVCGKSDMDDWTPRDITITGLEIIGSEVFAEVCPSTKIQFIKVWREATPEELEAAKAYEDYKAAVEKAGLTFHGVER